MHTIFKDFSFAAAHAIRGHTRGCENMHGHNYRVRVHLRAARLDELGMVLDFADLKAIMQEVLGPFDHRVLNEVPPFDRRNTTAELLAEHVFAEVASRLPAAAAVAEADTGGSRRRAAGSAAAGSGRGLAVTRVEVWENDSSCAAYEP
jgi:6-pyruvoyltetrahydropterin/6-carboxytetrahydropterin synthase